MPVFSFAQKKIVADMLKKKCDDLHCPLFIEKRDFAVDVLEKTPSGQRFLYVNHKTGERMELFTPELNIVQTRNIGLVLFILETLFSIPLEKMRKEIKKIYIPGRFEIISKKPLRVFDPCHTPESFKNFLKSFSVIEKPSKSVLCIFLLKDKKIKTIFSMAKDAGFKKIYWIDLPVLRKKDPSSFFCKDLILSSENFSKLWKNYKGSLACVGSFYLAPLITLKRF